MEYPIILTDKALLENFHKALPSLCYEDSTFAGSTKTHKDEINDLLADMVRAATADDKFSFFAYAAGKRRLEGEDDDLFKLWRTGLVAALHVLKRHDRRENPSRNDVNVTPPLTEELVSYYRKLRKYEPLLYASDPRYRDHFAHVLRVWMLGIVIAIDLGPENVLQLSLIPGKAITPAPFSSEERLAVYTVAALTHDMGYPIEKIFKLNKSVGEMFTAYGGLDLQDLEFAFSAPHHQMAQVTMKLIAAKPRYQPRSQNSREEEISNWLKDYEDVSNLEDYQHVNERHEKSLKITLRAQWKYFQKYARALERNQHGFLSTLLLQRKLLFFREGEFSLDEDYEFALEEVRQFIIRREILRAVATHTCPDIYFMSATSPEALLFFCDEIQDWGRPRFQQLYEGDLTGKSAVVKLNAYGKNSVSWETIIQPDTFKDFAKIVFGIAYNLYIRLRSAPDSRRRSFSLCWTCTFDSKEHPVTARFEFAKTNTTQAFRFDVKGVSTASGMEFLDRAATGAMSLDECKRRFVNAVEGLLPKKTS